MAAGYAGLIMDDLSRLMLFARDGDRDAFADIVRRSSAEVTHFVQQLTPGLDIDDIVQDTFVRLWRSLPNFRNEASGRTYLFAIARRAAVDELRRSQRRRRIARSLHSIDRASDLAEVHAMDALVLSLSQQHRESFVLTQMLGFSYDETANIVGAPIGTVRSRVARAREELAGGYRANDRSTGA